MRCLADENVPVPSIQLLRRSGFDVEAIAETAPGSPDQDVLRMAIRSDRLLLTFDRDFGELVYRHGSAVPRGIVYLRLRPSDPEEAGRVLVDLFERGGIAFDGRFTVVDRERIRQRPLLKVE